MEAADAIDAREHYDLLIVEDNDPVRDPAPLRDYMEKYDGERFLEALELSPEKTALEIGIGTGRLAVRTAPHCRRLVGIDFSPRTIGRARENLAHLANVELICDDFLTHDFREKFDVVYSSLTLMHFADKRGFLSKACSLMARGAVLCLSLDKDRQEYIDFGSRRIRIYPDDAEKIERYMKEENLKNVRRFETELADIVVGKKAE